jgi:ABC-type Fe3+ transport system substrate-binding protein
VKKGTKKGWLIAIIVILILIVAQNVTNKSRDSNKYITRGKTFRLISSSENADLEQTLQEFARKNNIKLSIDYAGTIDIMEKLNNKEQYDAVWTSNSIWLYMLDKSVSVKNSKSTSINPVVFGIKKSKAKELGFIDKEVSTKDILTEIQNGKLKFSMSSATQTNTGATAYLGFLATLAGNPEILKVEDLDNVELRENVKNLFSGVTRTSGSEEFLEEMFIKGDYEAVVTYETSIININKKLEEQGREPLYIIYAKDGVSISDSPLAYIDNSDKDKLEIFEKLQSYILSEEGQQELLKTGRRVWYGGVNPNADKTIGVLGCGINVIYPKENAYLYERMKKSGLILSEYPMHVKPLAYHFPWRNRLIAALSDNLVVIEATYKSGTMITVNECLELSVPIYCVPTAFQNVKYQGCNYLINNGANILVDINDVDDI